MNIVREAALILIVAAAPVLMPGNSMAGRTQIVLQWLDTDGEGIGTWRLFRMESALEAAGKDIYVVDGYDRGSGTTNIFLYADDHRVKAAVDAAVGVFEQGKLPAGMRIGRAVYVDEQRRDWTYKPVFPAGLSEFKITYR